MLEQIALFLGSLVVVVIASHFVIRSAVKIAEHFGIGEAAIGFIFIAVFTSFPELMVAITAATLNQPGIVIGNVLGSNIVNILLVLGIMIMLRGIRVKHHELVDNAEILLLITFAPLIFFLRGTLGFYEGMILILLFAMYAFFIAQERFHFKLDNHVSGKKWIVTNIAFWFGMIVVIIAAHYLVLSGAEFATLMGVPESLIAVTIIAFGTSMPELAIDISAIKAKHGGMALGTILGSCVVNLTLVLGAGAVISPITADYTVFASTIAFLVGVCLLLWYLIVKHGELKKEHGVLFVLLYIGFILVLVLEQVVA